MKDFKLILAFILNIFISNFCLAQTDTTVNKQEKGYFNITELGYYYGGNDKTVQLGANSSKTTFDAVNTISLRNINGFFLTNHLSLGVGVGLDGFQVKKGPFFNTFQLFGDVRYYFKNQDATWYAYGNLGKAIKIDPHFEKGLAGGGGIGIKAMVSWKTALLVSFGYQEQEIKSQSTLRQRIPSVAFKVGLLF
jgi:hypothetical protein